MKTSTKRWAVAVWVLLGCAFPALLSQGSEGKVSVAVGQVTLTRAGEAAETPLKVGDAVPVGSTVKTGASSRAVVVTTRQSAVRIADNSAVVVETLEDADAAPKVLLQITSGSLGALIQPQAQSVMDFKVKTPSGVAAARGTFFSVAVEKGKGFVQVKEGKVDVTPVDAKKEEPRPGRVTVAVGDVKETPPGGGAARNLAVGDVVQAGSTIRTGDNSRAVITMTVQSAIRVGPNSETIVQELVTAADAPKVLLDLKSGSMGALINPEAKGKVDFKIKTPSGVAAARGTFFSVAVEDGRGYIQTKTGNVNIIPLEAFNKGGAGAASPTN